MRMVYCTFSVVGFHMYPAAPTPIDYLSQNHRHEFNFKVSIEVTHDNREIEFHTLKRDCIKIIDFVFHTNEHNEIEFGAMSCEMIADVLAANLIKDNKYNMLPSTEKTYSLPRQIIIDVDEDGENGGIVYRR